MNDINSILDELTALEIELKVKKKRLEYLKTWCKDRAPFGTDKYVCTLKNQSRTVIVSLKEATMILGGDFIEAFKLVRTTEFTILQVSALENLEITVGP